MSLQARSDMELWDRPFQTLLLAVIFINILVHAGSVPNWVIGASVFCIGWKLLHLYKSFPLPHRSLLFVAGISSIVAIFFTYGTTFGNEAATPILVFLATLKLLETNRDRDAMFVILTGYFLLMAHLLSSQSLASTFFMALDVALITLLMYQLHRTDRHLSRSVLRPVARYLLYTIPVWLFLFMVFPRFSMNISRNQAPTPTVGFSEDLDSGSVSQLIESTEVAFRAKFLRGPRRSLEEMYWKGAVLYNGSDFRWKPESETILNRFALDLKTLKVRAEGLNLSDDLASEYEITLEPGGGRTLFMLPRLVEFDPGASGLLLRPYLSYGEMPRFSLDRRDRVQYRATSISESQSPLQTLIPREQLLASTVSPAPSDRMVKLAADLKAQIKTQSGPAFTAVALLKVQDFFSSNGFRYSLKIPGGRIEKLDDFMFERKVGFCEHYAAASTTLLRLMGIPARVAVGFLGGRYNPLSKSYIVRNRDAHAWVEVWSPSKADSTQGRWQTFDPTAFIVPLRRQLGGDFYSLPEDQQLADTSQEQAIQSLKRNFAMNLVAQSELLWDFAQVHWTNFILNYDSSGQRDFINSLLSSIGLNYSPIVFFGLCLAFLAILVRVIVLYRARRLRGDRIENEWIRLLQEFDRLKIRQEVSDGPLILIERSKQHQVLSNAIELWIRFRYGGSIEPVQPSAMARALREARYFARRLKAS